MSIPQGRLSFIYRRLIFVYDETVCINHVQCESSSFLSDSNTLPFVDLNPLTY